MSLAIITEDGQLFGRPILDYACTCGGFVTDKVLVRDEPLARDAMAQHWLDEHPDELEARGMGPCGVCGTITDHLKMMTPDGHTYVCEDHAPNDNLRAIFGSAG